MSMENDTDVRLAEVLGSLGSGVRSEIMGIIDECYFKKPVDMNGNLIDIGSWVRGESGPTVRVGGIAVDKYGGYILRIDDPDGGYGHWASLLDGTVVVEDPKLTFLKEYAAAYSNTECDAEREAITMMYADNMKGVM